MDDALGIHFPITKANQLCKCSDTVWTVYSHVHCIFCVAIYLFSNTLTMIYLTNTFNSNRDDVVKNKEGLEIETNITINRDNKLSWC